MRRLAKLVVLFPFLLAACSATGSSNDGHNDRSKGPDGGDEGTGGQGGNFEDPFDGDASDDPGAAVAHLRGKVFAPEGTIPISGALVYLSPTMPADIPDSVYCDKCVQLDKTTPYTFTAANGQFDLGAYQTGEQYLIVQKGQFRRVRRIDVVEGEQDVPKEKTTFPNKTMKPFDTIPKMAIITGAWDSIDVSLAKLGLGTAKPTGILGKMEVDRATAPYDYFENTWPPGGANSPDSILKDPNVISKYHIVFKPCSGSDGTTCNDFVPDNKDVQKNLRDYVNKGGKLYATDYSYEYVRRTWPGYINWQGEGSATGSACNGGGSNGPATVPDSGLGSWLASMGFVDWEIQGAWTGIAKVNPVNALDVDGNPATITPKVWVQSGSRPATVSFEAGCGRVMFSTYHTEVGEDKAIPQQMALLYVLLEVGVCVAPPVVK